MYAFGSRLALQCRGSCRAQPYSILRILPVTKEQIANLLKSSAPASPLRRAINMGDEKLRFSIDRGGTFTDVFCQHGDEQVTPCAHPKSPWSL